MRFLLSIKIIFFFLHNDRCHARALYISFSIYERCRLLVLYSLSCAHFSSPYMSSPVVGECHKALDVVASLVKCVSMSTRQIGQCLFVTNHWSTQSVWKRCMHGKRLQRKTKYFLYNNKLCT